MPCVPLVLVTHTYIHGNFVDSASNTVDQNMNIITQYGLCALVLVLGLGLSSYVLLYNYYVLHIYVLTYYDGIHISVPVHETPTNIVEVHPPEVFHVPGPVPCAVQPSSGHGGTVTRTWRKVTMTHFTTHRLYSSHTILMPQRN